MAYNLRKYLYHLLERALAKAANNDALDAWCLVYPNLGGVKRHCHSPTLTQERSWCDHIMQWNPPHHKASLAHNVSFWAQKLTHFVSFWSQ